LLWGVLNPNFIHRQLQDKEILKLISRKVDSMLTSLEIRQRVPYG